MNYKEMWEKALKGRSVNKASQDWGIPQPTLNRYVRGKNMPDYQTALIIAREAGIDPGEVVRICAEEESVKKPRSMFAEMGYAVATLIVSVNLFLTPSPAEAKQINDLQPTMSRGICIMLNCWFDAPTIFMGRLLDINQV